jgi:hypothetical protein
LAASIFNPGGGFVKKPFLELTDEDYSRALDSQAYVLSPYQEVLLQPLIIRTEKAHSTSLSALCPFF